MTRVSERRAAPKTPLPVLTYHNVAPAPAGATHRGLYLAPEKFERHMQILARRDYRGLSIDAALPYLTGEQHGKVAAITFDDGYQDNLERALPILLKYGFAATCYLVSDCIGTHNQWDAQLLKVEKPLMDVAAIQRWIGAGMHVGSHTCSHPHLSQLTTADKRREILQSKSRLEALLNVPIDHLCFPYGDYDQECIDLAREAGYLTAVTTERGRVHAGENLLTLPRLGNSGKRSPLVFLARTLLWR